MGKPGRGKRPRERGGRRTGGSAPPEPPPQRRAVRRPRPGSASAYPGAGPEGFRRLRQRGNMSERASRGFSSVKAAAIYLFLLFFFFFKVHVAPRIALYNWHFGSEQSTRSVFRVFCSLPAGPGAAAGVSEPPVAPRGLLQVTNEPREGKGRCGKWHRCKSAFNLRPRLTWGAVVELVLGTRSAFGKMVII